MQPITSSAILGCLAGTLLHSAAGIAGAAPADAPWEVPIDATEEVTAADYLHTDPTMWETRWFRSPFPFDELIYSWQVRTNTGEGFRLHLQVELENGTLSPMLYAGYWGDVPLDTEQRRRNPAFDEGHIAMDQLLLKEGTKAVAWRFQLESVGPNVLTELPGMTVIVTDNAPPAETASKFRAPASEEIHRARILDLPYRPQRDSLGNKTPDRCQSAAVATAMDFYGVELPLEEIIRWTDDPEYRYPGIWPRTLGAATQHGLTAYIDRFRTWAKVRATLAEGKVILCSINMNKHPGPWIAPPYRGGMGGHIVALCGLTEDGRVIVTDSAFDTAERGRYSQWLAVDFQKVWMGNGGVGMVVVPPDGAVIAELDPSAIQPFPISQVRAPAPPPDQTPAQPAE